MLSSSFSRRQSLQLAAAAGFGLFCPGGVFAAPQGAVGSGRANAPDWNRSLVMIELAGGNDGINTVIPYTQGAYYDARPQLAIQAADVLPLSGQFGLHPACTGLHAMWEAEDLAVVHGVGYDKPNRSHFRGIDIWNTASEALTFQETGWAGRLLDHHADPADLVAHGVLLSRYGSNPAEHRNLAMLAMSNPNSFLKDTEGITAPSGNAGGNQSLAHILKIQSDVVSAADAFKTRLDPAPAFTVEFPDTSLGKQLKGIAEMIVAGIKVPFFKAARSGFDTHASQPDRHTSLLQELSDAMAAFRAALIEHGHWNETLVMTYAEFGRRLNENGSRGTDHGAAAVQFVAGGRVRGKAFYGAAPSLTDLDRRGDMIYSVEHRNYFATGAAFLGMDAEAALGTGFTGLPLL